MKYEISEEVLKAAINYVSALPSGQFSVGDAASVLNALRSCKPLPEPTPDDNEPDE